MFDEDFFGAANHHLVALERDGVLEFHEARMACRFFFGREDLGFVERFSALARAVDEHVRRVKLAGFKCLDRLFKIFVSFTDKSANHVC